MKNEPSGVYREKKRHQEKKGPRLVYFSLSSCLQIFFFSGHTMDFDSFGLDTTKGQSGQVTYSHDIDTKDLDATDFFAFIDLPDFHSTTGPELQNNNQQPEKSNSSGLATASFESSITKQPQALLDTAMTSVTANTDLMSPMLNNINNQHQLSGTPAAIDYIQEDEVKRAE